MKNVSSQLIVVALASALFAGCGGGGGRGTTLPSTAVPGTAPGASAASGSSSVSMVIAIPSAATATASVRRSPQYLPSNVTSMKVVISQGAVVFSSQTIALTAGSPGCSSAPPVTCSATFQVPIGNDTFGLTSFDAAQHSISHALVTRSIVAGVNQLAVTLNGIVHEIAVLPGVPDFSIYEGATSKGNTQTANLSALDADGNVIVGVFDSPINITSDETLFTIAGNVATVATSADTFQYGYNLPDPYTGSATFSAGPAIFLAQPKIDNAKTLVAFAHEGAIAVWYDFADTAPGAFTAAAGRVSAWQDRNGSANAVTQAVASAQPSIVQGGFTHNPNQNTLQNISFTAGQCLVSPSGFPTGNYTMFVVAIGSGAPGTLMGPFGTPGTYAHALTIPTASEIDVIDHGAAGPTLTGLGFASPKSYYTTVKVESAVATLWFHGIPVAGPATGTLAAAAGTRDPGFILNAGNALCSTGSAANQLGEVLVLDHAASDAERLTIEEYLHRKWDI
jgi:hypothetical protein